MLEAETELGATSGRPLRTGQVIAGRYEVREEIGRGGMGIVYRVHDRVLGGECALKVMNPRLPGTSSALDRFLQEAKISLELSHEGIVRVRDLGRAGNLYYLTMELLHGRSLRQWLAHLRAEGRLPPIELVQSIVAQILRALDYAHRFTVHRDLKPANIFLVGREPDLHVKLLDFGIAKALDHDGPTSTDASLGTTWYMAPEQLGGARDVDARADLFSVGAVLYELLTGEVPHGSLRRPSAVRENLDPGWDDLVFSALDASPERRPRSAREFLERLERLPLPGSRRSARRYVAWILVLLALAGVAGIAVRDALVPGTPRLPGARPCTLPGRDPGDQCILRVAGVEVSLRWIPPGEGLLGSPDDEPCRDDDERRHLVRFSSGFWMGETEVTRELWVAVMEDDHGMLAGGDPSLPVDRVAWDDVREFLARINELAPGGTFRLPTEDEWEYAARAGSSGPFGLSCPDYRESTCRGVAPCLDRFAWYRGNSHGRMHPVGSVAPNRWGLHDMHGNVWEWCEDSPHVDGTPPSARGRRPHLLRGGSWKSPPAQLRSANRGRYSPGERYPGIGFRLVWIPGAGEGRTGPGSSREEGGEP